MIIDFSSLAQALGLIVIALAAAGGALVFMAWDRPRTGAPATVPGEEISFLFREETLVDASDAGRRLMDLAPPPGTDLTRLTGFLTPTFQAFRSELASLSEGESALISGSEGAVKLHVRKQPSGTRITLEICAENPSVETPDRFSLEMVACELQMHRTFDDRTPFPIWRQTENDRILWSNAAYRALVEDLGHDCSELEELPQVFHEDLAAGARTGKVIRSYLTLPQETQPCWFELQVNQLGDDLIVAAVPVDRIVRAERSLQDFVQALTQTFAHLSVGLAVFKRNRRMGIFNPALADMMDLSPEYLIENPTLFEFFDRLREKRLIPEPKDYKSWRRQMSALEAAAADSPHTETWNLYDGRTFRVTGRPHPEGAVAFLFEDISDEIALERQFRAELQLGQSVIDGLNEAIAVFSPSGELSMSNRAYAALWHERPSLDPGSLSFTEASRSWQKKCAPTPIWGDARDFAATVGERSNWTAEVRLRSGRTLICRFETMPGRQTLVGFSEPSGAMLAPMLVDEPSISA